MLMKMQNNLIKFLIFFLYFNINKQMNCKIYKHFYFIASTNLIESYIVTFNISNKMYQFNLFLKDK